MAKRTGKREKRSGRKSCREWISDERAKERKRKRKGGRV